MEALNPSRCSMDRVAEVLSVDALEPLKPLRICLLGYRSHPFSGGQGVYLNNLSKALVELGHTVDVISGQPYPQLDPRVRLIKLPGMNLYETGLLSLRPQHLRSYSNIVEWLSKLSGGFAEPYAFGRRALRHLREHGRHYDIVHDNQSLSYSMLALQRQLPLVTTIHHPITSDLRIALAASRSWRARVLARRWHSFLRMQKRVATSLRHLVTVSACSRQDIARDFGIDETALAVIHNGIDTEVFAPLPGVERKPLQLMATASADQPLKGLAILLKAFAELRQQFSGLRLVVVAKPRKGGATETLVHTLGLGDSIEFRSGIPTAELVRLYAEATLVVVPSLYEGFGLPAGEAMACAAPLISTDGGALPEVVGDAGVIVPAGDVAALAAAIRSLLSDPARREELGRRGRERVLEQFCWKRTARQMTRYYHSVLAKYRAP